MKILSKFRSLHRSLFIFLALMLVLSPIAPMAKTFADAPDPVLPFGGVVTTDGSGNPVFTLSGNWQWTTHFDNKGDGSKDCNQDRYAAGYAIDWHDATQPGNLVQNGSIIAHVGTPTDNNVHYIHLATDANPTGDPTGATRCGVYAQHGVDSHGHPIFYNTGNWGSISHTYPAGTTTFNACVVTYDVHNDAHTTDGVKAGDLVAGGPGHNGDNSVEKNGSTPLGDGCFSATVPPTLNLAKSVTNDNGGTNTPHDWTLSATGASSSFSDFGDSTTFHQVDAGVTYTLSESNVPGYAATGDYLCNGGVQSGNTITLSAGQNVTCTINNDDIAPSLTLNKIVSNTHGGSAHESDWTISATGSTSISGPGAAGSTDVVSGPDFSAGTYKLSESAGPSGYSASAWSCTNGVTVNGQAQITLANGQSTVCTITNSDVAPSLTVVKNVTNNNGGTKTADFFPLKVNGTTLTGGTLSNNNLTDTYTYSNPVAGTAYTVSETQQTGYSQTSLACADNDTHAVVTNPVTLNPGQHVTCTIANDDIAPSLTVNKLVINPYGTPAPVSSFPLFVDSTQVTSGQTNQFNAGNHDITETQQTGYTQTAGDCGNKASTFKNNTLSLTLDLGDNVTCTLTNTAVQPMLKVIKHVVNNNGGNKSADDFTMTVTGNSQSVTPFPGDENGTMVGLNEGSYNVDEQSHVGYTESFSGDCDSTISIGQTKTCTITNTDIAPTLKLVKHVINNNSGNNKPGDWMLTATGTKGFSDFGDSTTFHTVDANVGYSLSESTIAGYTSQGWSCDSGNLNGSTITLGLAQNVTCTITNDDNPNPAIQVVKDGPATAHEGDTVTYTFDVTNIGDTQTLSGITVDDSLAGTGNYVSGDTNTNGLLDKGEIWHYTAQYTIPTPQVPDVTNTVKACGFFNQTKVCDTDNHTLDVIHPAINVEKAGPQTAFAGDTVTYTFYVTNPGDTPLSINKVNDNVAGDGVYVSGDTHDIGFLDTDETWVYTKQFTIPSTQTSDIANTVTACGSDSLKLQVCNTDSHTTTVLNPGIHVVKSGPATAEPGQTVTYTFTVTNTGNTPLDSVTVNDNVAGKGTYQSGDANNDNILETTEAWIYTASYTIPANQNVSVTNTVTACGSPSNPQVEDELSLNITTTGHQVCDQDKHTTNIPMVLGSATVSTPPTLVNTGQNALFSIFAGLAVIGSVGTLTWASKKK